MGKFLSKSAGLVSLAMFAGVTQQLFAAVIYDNSLHDLTNRFNPPCYINPEYFVFWSAQPPEADQKRFTSQDSPVQGIYGCCLDSYQDLIVLRDRFSYLHELEHIRWSVLGA